MKPTDLNDVASAVLPIMAGFSAPWCAAGGWALDLWLGRTTRPHADIEVALFRDDQELLHRHLHGWSLEKIVDGDAQHWNEAEKLELPIHEIHARSKGEPSRACEFLLNERRGGDWVFRRNPVVVLPLDLAIVQSDFGVPVLAPELVLLYKAKSPRAKDEADFLMNCVALDSHQRRWLAASLAICHPDHPWLQRL